MQDSWQRRIPLCFLLLPMVSLAEDRGPATCDQPRLVALDLRIQGQFDGCFLRETLPLIDGRSTEVRFLVYCDTLESRGLPNSRDVESIPVQRGSVSEKPGVPSFRWWFEPVPAEPKAVEWDGPLGQGCVARAEGPHPERVIPPDERCRRAPGPAVGVYSGLLRGPLPRVLVLDLDKLFPVDGAYVLTSGIGNYKTATNTRSGTVLLACRPKTPSEQTFVVVSRALIAVRRGDPDAALAEIDEAWSKVPKADLPLVAIARAKAFGAKNNLDEECRWARWAFEAAPHLAPREVALDRACPAISRNTAP